MKRGPIHSFWSSRNGFNGFIETLSAFWASELVGAWGWAHEFLETRKTRKRGPSHSFCSSRNGFNGFIETLSAFDFDKEL